MKPIMKIFIPTNELSDEYIAKGYTLQPLIIDAYKYHLEDFISEKTQNLFSKKEKSGTVTIKIGRTRVE